MIDYCIKKHGKFGIIIDTNLLLLLLIGEYSPQYICHYKRTQKYSIEDFEWICLILKYFSKVVVTPHILAEVWNFAEKIPEHHLVDFIKSSIEQLSLFDEDYIDKETILRDKDQLKYIGVTDLSIIYAAKQGNYVVLTDDLRAYNSYMINEVTALNLNHIRTEEWL